MDVSAEDFPEDLARSLCRERAAGSWFNERMTSRLVLLGFVLGLFAAACAPESRAAEYGTKVAFKKNTPVTFAEFALTYLGERHVQSQVYPRGFTVHDFQVGSGPGTQKISWSSGTGDIGPTIFRVGGKQFGLELSRSDKLGPLKANELVVTPAR